MFRKEKKRLWSEIGGNDSWPHALKGLIQRKGNRPTLHCSKYRTRTKEGQFFWVDFSSRQNFLFRRVMLQTKGCQGASFLSSENNLAEVGKTVSRVLSDGRLATCALHYPTPCHNVCSTVNHCSNLQPPKTQSQHIFSDNTPVSFWPLKFLTILQP